MTNNLSFFSSWTFQDFSVAGFPIQLYDCNVPKAPIVYLLAHQMDPELLSLLQEKSLPAFSLACIGISSTQWNTLLAPWNTPSNFPKYLRCQGEASRFLKIFLNDILPAIQNHLSSFSGVQTMAGYSLAGLFSLWALCEWEQLEGVCAVSGSFWYPDFQTWFLDHFPLHLPICVYFSTSESEWTSQNARLSSLKPTLEAIEQSLAQKGVKTICQIHPGNHFQEPTKRLVLGIEWMITHLVP